MKLVIMESPYAGNVERNTAYARACVKDCLNRGEAPLASHLLYTQPGILRDGIAAERELGVKAGQAWLRLAEVVAIYMDLGLSPGVVDAINLANYYKIPLEYRKLTGDVFSRLLDDVK